MSKAIKFYFWSWLCELIFVLREDWLGRLQTFCDDRAAKHDIFA